MKLYGFWGIHYHYYTGNNIKALKKLKAAYEIAIQYQFLNLLASNCYWMGYCYRQIELYDKAVEYTKKGIEVGKQLGKHKDVAEGITIIIILVMKTPI